MRYNITSIIEDYPEAHIGVLVGSEMDNTRNIPELPHLQGDAINRARNEIGDNPSTKHPHIYSWREIYRSFGTKAGDYRPSAEALVRRCIKEGKLPRINNAVDLYNLISVRHIIPMGGFDLDQIAGNIYLRYSPGGENFKPLGSGKTEETYEGEIVYADTKRILTRRWNYRDAEVTKITKETSNLVMFLDASPQISVEKVRKAMDELCSLYKKYCGGEYSTFVAGKDEPVIELGN